MKKSGVSFNKNKQSLNYYYFTIVLFGEVFFSICHRKLFNQDIKTYGEGKNEINRLIFFQ